MKQDSGKVRLSMLQIIEMNIGFLGLQFSFGLQQSNMSPIYTYLGAHEAAIPLLTLAGPMTGLLVQPLIGAMSDRTVTKWGRRTPYFLIGAIFCSLGLLAMPYSPALWVAASLLWILDAANNITMEPYRAYVSDMLIPAQRPVGFLTQSGFTGLGQTLAYLTPSIMVWLGVDRNLVDAHNIPIITKIAFGIGSALSITTILWSIIRVRERKVTPAELFEMQKKKMGLGVALGDIWDAIVEMPKPMRQLGVMCLFQWYGMFIYWEYIALSFGRSLFHTIDPTAPGYREAVLVNGQLGGFYNFIAFIAAFSMTPLTKKFGAKRMHGVCLLLAGAGMIALPNISSRLWLFVPMVGVGCGWASMMGNPYVMLANSIPPKRTGVYMGIFNMFIVIPMLIEGVTLPLFYQSWLGGDSRNAIMLAGALLLVAALAAQFVAKPDQEEVRPLLSPVSH
jgi:maltose/moltooligosaccharide transporter